MNPTVSETSSSRRSGQPHPADQRIEGDEQGVRRHRLVAGQRVEERGLAGVGVADQRHGRHRGLVPPLPRLGATAADARRSPSTTMLTRWRMRRRSVSSFVSPGPGCRCRRRAATARRSHPTSRGIRYCSCASSTCSLPSRVRARLAKMSRMSCVRSSTLRSSAFSRLRSCAGLSSLSKIDDVGVESRRRQPRAVRACRCRGRSRDPASAAPASRAARRPRPRPTPVRRARRGMFGIEAAGRAADQPDERRALAANRASRALGRRPRHCAEF